MVSRHRERFSKFAHDTLYGATHQIKLPLSGTVFDYCLDNSTGNFVRWSQKAQERSKAIAQGYVVTPEVEKYMFLTELLINSYQPVLLTGQPGVGKSSLINVSVMSYSGGLRNCILSSKITCKMLEALMH